ncbi:MAG: rod shape-determining protein MreC [Rhodospirillales bacterium]|nr:rod shape-determining protein MreC [Rhodospirillales bacterium]
MPAALKSFFHWFVYAGLVVFAGGLMLLGKADTILIERLRLKVDDVAVPVLEVLSEPADALARVLEGAQRWINVADENARLREERERLLRWQAIAQRLEVENAGLRQLLKVVPEPQATYRSARVVADSTGVFAQSVLISAGSLAGIERGQNVLTGEGLVGRIVGVSARASRVLLITDLNSRVPVFVGPSNVRAVLAGDNSERPKLVHIVPGAAIEPGDLVVTSGIAGGFPPGLPVGSIDKVDDEVVTVTPNIDRNRLEYVRIADYGMDFLKVDAPLATKEERPSQAAGNNLGGESAQRTDARR